MPSDPPAPALTPEIVALLARLEGFPPLDAETAARIAVGATQAVRAVAATATLDLFDTEPAAYAAELERAAEPD
jgi:hypothetical protein